MCVYAVCCVVGQCTVWHGGVLCVSGGYCVVGRCNVCQDGILGVRVV